jgi:hypothetical protein
VKPRDVIDLEVQLALDAAQDETALRARDRALYLTLSPPPTDTHALLAAWLEALRQRFGAPLIGERVTTAQRLLAYVLALLGAASGWGLAEALLRFEQGGAPVNVGHYLVVMVGGQLVLLVLLGVGLVLRRVWPDLPLLGDAGRLLRFAATRLSRAWARAHPDAAQRLEVEQAALRRVRTRIGLYRRLEQYLLLSLTQLFALAFNLGALCSCLRLILLSDLAFSWSTSLTSLSAADVQRLCAALAWPFAWLVPEALPSAALIEHTQYFRLEGRFAGAAAGSRGDAALVGEWWRFLVACTVTYGLMPRLVTFVWCVLGQRAAERDLPLDTPPVLRVLARLTTPELSTRAAQLDAQGAAPALPVPPAVALADSGTALILYRDIPTAAPALERALAQHLGLRVISVHRAGGLDVAADAALCARLAEGSASVTLVAEAWEAPDRSLRHLLSALRSAIGPRRALRVALIGEAASQGFAAPSPDDARVFRDRLTLLEDPYLAVETLPRSDAALGTDAGGRL